MSPKRGLANGGVRARTPAAPSRLHGSAPWGHSTRPCSSWTATLAALTRAPLHISQPAGLQPRPRMEWSTSQPPGSLQTMSSAGRAEIPEHAEGRLRNHVVRVAVHAVRSCTFDTMLEPLHARPFDIQTGRSGDSIHHGRRKDDVQMIEVARDEAMLMQLPGDALPYGGAASRPFEVQVRGQATLLDIGGREEVPDVEDPLGPGHSAPVSGVFLPEPKSLVPLLDRDIAQPRLEGGVLVGEEHALLPPRESIPKLDPESALGVDR